MNANNPQEAINSGWTRHGHRIDGLAQQWGTKPPTARCGGARICHKCRADAKAGIEAKRHNERSVRARAVFTAAAGDFGNNWEPAEIRKKPKPL